MLGIIAAICLRSPLVEIYRPDGDVVTLGDGDVLTIPDLLPGFEVTVADLWSPEFE